MGEGEGRKGPAGLGFFLFVRVQHMQLQCEFGCVLAAPAETTGVGAGYGIFTEPSRPLGETIHACKYDFYQPRI